MFAPEFEHIIKLMETGLHFECPQAQDMKNIYTVYKNRYEAQKAIFEEIKEKPVRELTFAQLLKISKELGLIKMNFETDEAKFKKELWKIKSQKLVEDYDVETKYSGDEKKEHRLYSDYIRVLYDDGQEAGIKASATKKVRKEGDKSES